MIPSIVRESSFLLTSLYAFLGILAFFGMNMIRQIRLYHKSRRINAQDYFPVLNLNQYKYVVASAVRLKKQNNNNNKNYNDNKDLLQVMKRLKELIECGKDNNTDGGVKNRMVVYVGRVAFIAMNSNQKDVEGKDWDGVILTAVTSGNHAGKVNRKIKEGLNIKSNNIDATAAKVEEFYSVIMKCNLLSFSSLLPFITLHINYRIQYWLNKTKPVYPFTTTNTILSDADALKNKVLLDVNAHGWEESSSLNLLNFMEHHTDPKKRKDNEQYNERMMSLFGEVGCGPLHIGKACKIFSTKVVHNNDGSATSTVSSADSSWNSVALVQYHNKDFFYKMVTSTFMNSSEVGMKKQLGDTLVLATIPIFSKLQ